MLNINWHWSNEDAQWASKEAGSERPLNAQLELNGLRYQKMYGFGGCFNELGWRAISHAAPEERAALYRELFSPDGDGARFNFCRLPIGASDYAFSWYSLDETPGDYNLECFSIERDKQALIPYLREALNVAPELSLMASPWSPPTWMKIRRYIIGESSSGQIKTSKPTPGTS